MTTLRIAVTADPYIAVPPRLYGGIERIIALLVRGLIARGHHLTLFAHPDSHVDGARLVPYGAAPHLGSAARLRELWQLGFPLWRHRRQFDVVHSFGRLAALVPLMPRRALPKIQSYQRAIPWSGVRRAVRLAGGSLRFTACSASLFRGHSNTSGDGRWDAIFNGVELDRYAFSAEVAGDAPLVFLGRLEPEKGAHVAIDIARRSGRRLVIAGNRVTAHAAYFDAQIAPAVDGDRIAYIGPVDDQQKNDLLGSAAELLFPTLFDEPFGIVMAESMACGTPVIALRNGAVPEVVRDGLTGYVCRTAEEAAAAVGRLDRIDRCAVRQDTERRFAAGVIVSQYEALYREALG
jgi:glycosyltransferase involved in cell wall biosynthesis